MMFTQNHKMLGISEIFSISRTVLLFLEIPPTFIQNKHQFTQFVYNHDCRAADVGRGVVKEAGLMVWFVGLSGATIQ